MSRRAPLPLACFLLACVLTVGSHGLPLPSAEAAEPAAPRPPARVPVARALEPLRPWLRHEDWTVRSIAAFDLRKRTEPGVIRLATLMLQKERNPYAAAGALGALRGRPRRELVMEGGADLVEALLRWSTAPHPTVRAYAREILFRLPPVKLGSDLKIYAGWWKRGHAAFEREQRAFLTAAAKAAKAAAKPPARAPGESTSLEPSRAKDDHFYGRLEKMRKHGLELCIVLDNTGSMGPVIGAAKRGTQRLIDRLRLYVPRFRAGLVTYDDLATVRATLTPNAEVLRKAFRKIGAGGGADLEEGVDKGIRAALKQERMGWSRQAVRVIVVVGDAPPHEADVPRLLRTLTLARQDVLYENPVVVHTVSTDDLPVLHFPQIAIAGGGQHVTLRNTRRLVEELVLLTFGGAERERVHAWMREIEKLHRAEKKAEKKAGKQAGKR